jgi:hypothetical protein
MSARRTVMIAAGLALAVGACGGGGSSSDTTSKAGTALLAEATTNGRAADAVSFRLRSSGSGTKTEESFARAGADSLVTVETDQNGRTEVRRVSGTIYVRSDLQLPGGQVAPWVRIDAGPDQETWTTLLGAALVAPTPKETTRLLTANIARVVDVVGRDPRVLATVPRDVATGEHPSSVSIAAGEARFVGRSSTLIVQRQTAAQRTYSAVRWNDAVEPITVPEGAESVEVVRDPQSAALPAALQRAPAALPAGWSLRSVVGITPSQGDGACQQVLTLYAPTGRPLSAGYLAVFLKPAGCETPKPDGAADFTAGANTGWIGQDRGASVGGLTVDGVSVRFRSTLSEAELSKVLATWGPPRP